MIPVLKTVVNGISICEISINRRRYRYVLVMNITHIYRFVLSRTLGIPKEQSLNHQRVEFFERTTNRDSLEKRIPSSEVLNFKSHITSTGSIMPLLPYV